MKSLQVQGNYRQALGGTNAKKLRRQGMVPCVMYGTGKNSHFYTEAKRVKDALYTPETMLIVVDLDGKKHNCVIRDAQFHPVTDDLEHIDLYEFEEGLPITVDIPVRLIGTPKGVRNGGRLKVNLRHLPVKAQVEDMPGMLEVNVERLKIGDALRIQDLNTEGIEILREPTRTLLTIQTARNVVVEEDDEDEDEEGTEEEGAEETTAEGEEAES